MWLFLILIAVPIIEIALFIQAGGLIGLWPTLALVILTAVIGATLVRIQGLNTLARLQRNLETGGDPVGPIAHGALILVAGLLLLTPGFFTDAVGLLLLVPPLRDILIRWGAARFAVQAAGSWRPGPGAATSRTQETIEVEYEVVGESGDSQKGDSGWTRHPR